MVCRKCKREIPGDAALCCYCGAATAAPAQRRKSRGNGQGSVYRLPNGKYIARKVSYYLDADGKRHKRTASRCFATKREAVNGLPALDPHKTAAKKAERKASTTFKGLFDLWFPTHEAGKETLDCYRAAVKYFSPIYNDRLTDVDIDDLQECIDECPRGKATRKNMRTTVGLMYKYGIPRGYLPEKLNLADYLSVKGSEGAGGAGLPIEYVEAIRKATGRSLSADYVLCHCYLGFRPSELLALTTADYNAEERAFTGGAKTEAGKNRIVTVSPKIQPIIDRLLAGKTSGQIFSAPDGGLLDIKAYRAMFYALLEDLGLENPTFEVNDQQKHTYTPHSCRHPFATLMKRVPGNNKDKLELIGHTSEEMLRYYQDVSLADLRRITDEI